jgi:hypothetical protein
LAVALDHELLRIRAVKFDKDMMALLKATRKAAKTPAAAIAERRKTHHDDGPPNESPAPDQNIEPPPGVGTAKRPAAVFRELAASRHVASSLLPATENWSADGTL